ncbi:bifunctional 4-hydroxy-3-methylbut-2-enyl diphosphate reductase/30S ribosomal protein S1 [Calderihabitans maritimus]|uniref:4-hydroxy-3-methylbut-2-enyl diphosphate reductase n=1 Tax=Calderihabitans maritimus TaxID=1246530 RepID=A0A1Z5HUL2_9FIRM|nr:bifunctional 4-hydroxy-3-methylbut-2-enyl diphosphate reductase/30S ribosomal protein S1 [Calderihabitans maritimus]GAW93229.1 4-hydroxy-3-methylbut-2-enyl diphosphate reductase [Calderihabitans maritimus]
MEIILAPNAGFCFGVKRAIKLAEQAGNENLPYYTLGPIIHNPQVVNRLEKNGIKAVTSLEEITTGGVIIRSHGVSPEVLEEAKSRKLRVVDATCPFVRRAQELAGELTDRGYQVVVVGDRSHPEVIGIVGWTGSRAIVVENAREAEKLGYYPQIGVIAQTTQSEQNFRQVVEVLKKKSKNLVVHNTICHATRQRQQAAAELARKVDLMIVVGGKESANTRKLARICSETGTPTYHIERADELCASWLQNKERVGVTAGASTPDWIIEEVVTRMTEIKQEEQKNAEEIQPVAENAEENAVPAAETGDMQDRGSELEAAEKVEAVEEPAEPAEEAPQDQEERQATETIPAAEYRDSAVVEEHLAENMRELRRGELIKGTVVQVTDDEVLVDVGGKSEGIIPLKELTYRPVTSATEVVEVGEEVEVFVIKPENEEGHPILSKRRADRIRAWERLEEAFKQQEDVEGEVIEEVKGGLLVDVGVRGFLPASLVDIGYVENLSAFVGQKLKLRVIELDRDKRKLVLSRKAILVEELEKKRQETWDSLKEGQVRKGIVRRLTDFGAFVDLGGVDGLLHVSELSWGRVEHPKDVLQEGQEIEVKVLGVDREAGKISLGLKQLQPNPWDTAAERYPVGSVVKGKVVRIAPFGAFVEVEPGIDGLVHISQLADRHVAKTEDVVSVGDEIPVKVLGVDEKAQRMSLSLREAQGSAAEKQNTKAKREPEETGVTIGELVGDILKEAKDEQ